MKTIQINKNDLINELANALERAGSTDWDIFVNAGGQVDTRHNTHPNSEWFEIVDLYDLAGFENDGKYPGDDGYDYNDSAAWMVNETDILPAAIEVFDDETMDFVNVGLDLVSADAE